jgi:hypothetical protein
MKVKVSSPSGTIFHYHFKYRGFADLTTQVNFVKHGVITTVVHSGSCVEASHQEKFILVLLVYKKLSLSISMYHTMKMYPYVTRHHAMMTYGGMEIQLHTFLTLALDEGNWSASCHSHCTMGERACSTHWIGDWVGPRVGLDTVTKRNKYPAPTENQTLVTQSVI